jgi:hypothetical protein
MHLAAKIVYLTDTLGGCDRASVEIHLQAEIESLRDVLGCRYRASLEMHLEPEINLNSEMHLEAVMKRD